MASAANANLNAVRETMDGKDCFHQCRHAISYGFRPLELSKNVNVDHSWICYDVSFTVLLEISRLLNTGLDMESLSICVRLCEQGINPEALSAVIKELRKASESLKVGKPHEDQLRVLDGWIYTYTA